MRIKDYYKEKQYIHYSNCHEDSAFVLEQIKNQPKRILSIASALDNCLAMLLLEPDEIVAIDSNDTQIYLSVLPRATAKAVMKRFGNILMRKHAITSTVIFTLFPM